MSANAELHHNSITYNRLVSNADCWSGADHAVSRTPYLNRARPDQTPPIITQTLRSAAPDGRQLKSRKRFAFKARKESSGIFGPVDNSAAPVDYRRRARVKRKFSTRSERAVIAESSIFCTRANLSRGA
jgi:hypothetical protein